MFVVFRVPLLADEEIDKKVGGSKGSDWLIYMGF